MCRLKISDKIVGEERRGGDMCSRGKYSSSYYRRYIEQRREEQMRKKIIVRQNDMVLDSVATDKQ